MKHVRQRHRTECGVAVLAMLGEVSYEAARLALAEKDAAIESVSPERMLEQLSRLSDCLWRPSSIRLRGWSDRELPQGPSAVTLHPPDRDTGHWLALADGQVFDPELFEPMQIEDYTRRSWPIGRVLVADRSEQARSSWALLKRIGWIQPVP